MSKIIHNTHKIKKLQNYIYLFNPINSLIHKRIIKFAALFNKLKEAPSNNDQQNFNPY